MSVFKRFFNIKNNIYKSKQVDLIENYRVNAEEAYDGIPTVFYSIYLHNSDTRIGKIDLRLSIDGDMYYYGHIGYRINPDFQGHNYAYYACEILLRIIRNEFNLKEVIITCSPDNIASKKTIEKLNGELIKTVDVPKNHQLYIMGEKVKLIYKIKI